jgi:hypothetical protein
MRAKAMLTESRNDGINNRARMNPRESSTTQYIGIVLKSSAEVPQVGDDLYLPVNWNQSGLGTYVEQTNDDGYSN